MSFFDFLKKPKVNLDTVEGIRAIPVPKKKETKPHDVKEGMEYILQRKATEHKKNGRMDLAIECLKKSNELMPYSIFEYTRSDYQRLVDFLKEAGRFEDARLEQKKLDEYYGTEIDWLKHMMSFEKGKAAKDAYYARVIFPKIQELKDREEYDWFCEFFPDKAPKSFGGYRKMKNSNSENFQKLMQAAHNAGFKG